MVENGLKVGNKKSEDRANRTSVATILSSAACHVRYSSTHTTGTMCFLRNLKHTAGYLYFGVQVQLHVQQYCCKMTCDVIPQQKIRVFDKGIYYSGGP